MRLDRFLDNEEERSKAGYVVMTDMIEQQISCTLSVNNINVKLYGYPDRIEREGGKYNILDYKNTIPLKKRYEIGEAFVEFQLPLYGMILSQDDFSLIRSLAYYRISRDVRISNICDEHDIPGYLVDFKEKILLPTIEEILSPDKPFCQTRTKTACKYCDFVALCGVANA
jgi:predicted RecB family nuclease